jgi:hypothetical protein
MTGSARPERTSGIQVCARLGEVIAMNPVDTMDLWPDEKDTLNSAGLLSPARTVTVSRRPMIVVAAGLEVHTHSLN